MKKSIYTIKTACIVALASLSTTAVVGKESSSMLQCHIQAPVTVKQGQAINLAFTLTNTSKKKLAILKWNTPLEGWFGSSFNVTRDGQWATYQGAMVKRFRPSASDYAEVEPGMAITAQVNMAEGYDMKKPGNYKLVFNGRLQDVQEATKGQELSPERKLHNLSCNELTVRVE